MNNIGSTAPFNPPVLMLEKPQPGISTSAPSDGFADKLRSILHEANATPKAGEDAMEAYASGENNDIHGTMIKVAQGDIALRLVSNIRSRVVEAYREVMRMGG